MRLRLLLRGLLRAPAFALASIGTIALAVCLSTTVFAVVDGVLFKPLPFSHPENLHIIGGLPSEGSYGGFSAADIAQLRAANPDVAIAIHGGGWIHTHPSRPGVELQGRRVSPNFFEVLGLGPLAGGFTPEDFARPPESTDPLPAIVSYAFWLEYTNGATAALGTVIRLADTSIRIAGVLPRDFVFPHFASSDMDLLFPMPDWWTIPGDPWDREFNAFVRLDPARRAEVTQRFDMALTAASKQYARPDDYPEAQAYERVTLEPFNENLGVNERPFFRLAFVVAALLVLIGCVNVTSLMLARTRDRARELRVRVALGASRRDIAGLVTGEVLLLTAIGAALGLWLANPALGLALHELPELSTLKAPAIDGRVVVFALLAPLTAMLMLSTVPVSRALRDAPLSMFATGTTPQTRSLGSSTMLAFESGMGIVLLVVGTLVLTSFSGLRQAPVGLRYQELGLVDVGHLGPSETVEERAAFQDRIIERMAAVPGVEGAAIFGGPLFERRYSALHMEPKGSDVRIWEVPVSSRFFEIAGLQLVEGRLPSAHEITRADSIMVLSRPAARGLFGLEPAVGRVVKGHTNTFTVVGVVEDVRTGSQREGSWGEAFTPIGQSERYYASFLFRSTADLDEVASRVAMALSRDIPGLLVEKAAPLDDAIAGTVKLQRFQASIFGITGGAALLLVSVGVAGIVAGSVRRRWREAGIRSALGASGGRIVRMLIADHLRPAAAGIALGLVGSWWMKDVLKRFLYELQPGDLRVWAAASALILLVVTLAAWLPARRAAQADPAMVLRAE